MADLSLREQGCPEVPLLELRYEDLTMSIPQQAVSEDVRSIPTVGGALLGFVSAPLTLARGLAGRLGGGGGSAKPAASLLPVLAGCSGVLRPGTLTLLIAPPGHGKSSFLKALTNNLPPGALKGRVEYSGLTPAELPGVGARLGSLAQYVGQVDEHIPQLTVRETLSFVHDNCSVDPGAHGYPHLSAAYNGRVQDVMDLLSLNGCASTPIGNDLMRGVSGGEKKRVTVAEGLLTEARFLALDEISTGLDSSVTFDIVKRLRIRAATQGLTAVVTLLQPTPETFALFDSVILMREGAVLFHGPTADLPAYLQGLGYHPPTVAQAKAAVEEGGSASGSASSSSASASKPTLRASPSTSNALSLSLDMADYLLQLLSDPEGVRGEEARVRGEAPGAPASYTTEELARLWKASPGHAALMRPSSPAVPRLALTGSYARAQFGDSGHAHPWLTHLGLLLSRQLKLMLRNLLYIRSRIMQAIFMSVVLGGLYYQRTREQGATLVGTFLNTLMIMGFANLSEMAPAVENKFVAYRQVGKGIYPGSTFVLSSAILHLPVALTETLLFTGVIYGMTGMQGNYFFYWLPCFLFDICMRNILVYFTLSASNLQAAQALPLPFIALMILFGGFLVTKDKMGWLEFLSYADPIAYGLRSMAINEFTSSAYGAPCTTSAGLGTCPPGIATLGQFFLNSFAIPTETQWMWGGWVFLAGFIALTLLGQLRVFATVKIDRNIGSVRKAHTAAKAAATATAAEVALPVAGGAPTSGSVASVALEPMTVAFFDLTYSVRLPKDGSTKQLLHGVSGYALPGRVLGLMGASGAGKSTLLDVLAGRKNTGVLGGGITLNGFPKEEATFNRVTAYVEQNDLHNPLATVREALLFSAQLRLPSHFSAGAREEYVDSILRMLELDDAGGRLVGRPGQPNSLAPHERKRLTLGVELVSNAPVLLLDEPTSNLDSSAAARVMRAIKNVANSGRTIICTVHQPSAELFFMFDDLLLLQRGGYQAFFGPLGPKAAHLTDYLAAQPGISPCPAGMNPASYMLDCLQGLDSTSGADAAVAAAAAPSPPPSPASPSQLQPQLAPPASGAKAHLEGALLHKAFTASPNGAAMLARLSEVGRPAPGASKVTFASAYAASYATQLTATCARQALAMWRNVPLNMGRFYALLGLNLMFGTIWFAIASNAGDLGGVQSLVAAVFMSAAFGAMVNMNTVVPAIIQGRSVLYREFSSNMFDPAMASLSFILNELPYTLFIIVSV